MFIKICDGWHLNTDIAMRIGKSGNETVLMHGVDALINYFDKEPDEVANEFNEKFFMKQKERLVFTNAGNNKYLYLRGITLIPHQNTALDKENTLALLNYLGVEYEIV